MKTLFLISIIIGIGIILAISGVLYYQDVYKQNCQSEGGFMTGFLRCTKTINDFATEEAMLADKYNGTLQEFHAPDRFSTGHKLYRIGNGGEETKLAEYFKDDSAIMLFYEYCNCTKSDEFIAGKKMIRADSQILDVDGIPVAAYPSVSDHSAGIDDKYVFEFYYDGYRISLHTDQRLDSGLGLVKELLDSEKSAKQNNDYMPYPVFSNEVLIPLGSWNPEKKINIIPKTIIITLEENPIVIWANQDYISSTLTADDNSWTTGLIKPGESVSIVFNHTGVFNYHGEPHPWKKGTIIVIPKNAELLSKQEKQDIAWHILQPYFPNPVIMLGVDDDGVLVVGIHEDELKKNPDAESYYIKKFKEMIPFYIPVKIQFGHVDLQ